jgi:uncharacterized membrane protein
VLKRADWIFLLLLVMASIDAVVALRVLTVPPSISWGAVELRPSMSAIADLMTAQSRK